MTYTEAADPLVNTLLGLVTVPTDWTKSATKAPPHVYAPNTVYCWPLRQEPRPAGMDFGDHVELWFFLRLAWSVGTDEEVGQVRLEAITDEIDTALATLQTLVRANRESAVWEWLQVDRTDPNAVTTFQERAGHLDLSGYRLV